jgi:hypothetical protein
MAMTHMQSNASALTLASYSPEIHIKLQLVKRILTETFQKCVPHIWQPDVRMHVVKMV